MPKFIDFHEVAPPLPVLPEMIQGAVAKIKD